MPEQLVQKLAGEHRHTQHRLSQENLSRQLLEARGELDRANRRLIQVTEEMVQAALSSTAIASQLWDACRQAVVAGETESIQAQRSTILEILREKRPVLVEALDAVRQTEASLEVELDLEQRLLRELGNYDRFIRPLVERWNSADDLEDLVAEWTAPTAEEFDNIAKKYGPPTAWIRQCGEAPSE